jgi:hypothetical protein
MLLADTQDPFPWVFLLLSKNGNVGVFMLTHGTTRTGQFTFIWAQGPCIDGKVASWSELFFKGRNSWGRTPGRAARALARHLDGISVKR